MTADTSSGDPNTETPSDPHPGFPAWGAVAVAFVFFAVAVEVISGSAANSMVPDWAYRVAPLAWSQPVRVVWWLVVGLASGMYRLAERRSGIHRSWVMIAISVLPFLVFAGGIAAGASWATWH